MAKEKQMNLIEFMERVPELHNKSLEEIARLCIMSPRRVSDFIDFIGSQYVSKAEKKLWLYVSADEWQKIVESERKVRGLHRIGLVTRIANSGRKSRGEYPPESFDDDSLHQEEALD
ncbi:MAG: hypothetical protein ABI758_00775 [Candidatus Woesebacteria bacterium]